MVHQHEKRFNGREVEHYPEAWLQSELARFHRGLSLTLLLLATAWLMAEMVRHRQPAEWLLLGALLAPITLLGRQWLSAFLESGKSRGVRGEAKPVGSCQTVLKS